MSLHRRDHLFLQLIYFASLTLVILPGSECGKSRCLAGFLSWGDDPVTSTDLKRKLAAILSADVKGYSRIMGEDEEWTLRTLKSCKALISERVQQHHGRGVDAPGDNLLAEFGSVVDAVGCAVEIQPSLPKKNDESSESRRMEFRIGVNLGDVVEDEGKFLGDGVNIATRLK